MIQSFSVTRRNPHHWDIYSSQHPRRMFTIRGEPKSDMAPGNIWVSDDRDVCSVTISKFDTVADAMFYISKMLMEE